SNIRCTRFGNFNLVPLPGETIIPRNFGHSPGSVVVSMRISRSFAFGTVGGASKAAAARPAGQAATSSGSETGRRPAGGPGGPGGPSGPRGDVALAKMAANGPSPQPAAEKRYNLTVS